MVVCLQQVANDLHMFQLMQLPPRHLLLTHVVLEKRPLNRRLSVHIIWYLLHYYCSSDMH